MKILIFLLVLLCSLRPGHAWSLAGHSLIAAGAVEALPPEVPDWFRAGAAQIAHDAQTPDIEKDKTLPMMNEAEYPRHFFDWELIGLDALPPTRRDFYRQCARKRVNPSEVGELPYVLAEWTQRLTMDFAQTRAFPNNAFARNKAIVTAGLLSHYAGDATMPLHVTVDYDGRADANGKSPRSGIHASVDSLIDKLRLTPTQLAQDQTIEPLPDLWQGIEAQLRESRSHIDQTYALESQLPLEKGAYTPSPAVSAFALERGRMATQFTAQLFLTAWRDSEKIVLPGWVRR